MSKNPPLTDLREVVRRSRDTNSAYVFVVLGASGSLAKKQIYPSLWFNFVDDLLPEKCFFLGYARSDLEIRDEISQNDAMKRKPGDEAKFADFLERNFYLSGTYDQEDSFAQLDDKIHEIISPEEGCHRIFHLALPPSVYSSVTQLLGENCKAEKPYFTRVIVEKPFGRDLESAKELSSHLAKFFEEDEIYRIDHYLGKEIVQNLIVLRFANALFESVWSRQTIQSVKILFKETMGVEGRGGFFDDFGIIRDIMQNHLMQILALLTMESPESMTEEDISAEKIKVLKCIREVQVEHSVIGQYIGNEEARQCGYAEDSSVPDDSHTPTFACSVLHIDNERWRGVPFIFYCGKALDEKKTEIHVQFRAAQSQMFAGVCPRNELVMRVSPDELVLLDVCIKQPGPTYEPHRTQLHLSYQEKLKNFYMPSAYERLLLDVFKGDQLHFARTEELAEAWRIFTPLLQKIEAGEMEPIEYVFGSAGIPAADDLCRNEGKFEVFQGDVLTSSQKD